MRADEAIYDRLKDLVADQCAPNIAGQDWVPPFIIFQRIGTVGVGSLIKDAGLFMARYQIAIYARPLTTARTLARQVRGLLGLTLSGQSDGIRVGIFEDEIDTTEDPPAGTERPIPKIIQTYTLTFRDEVE